jgi:glycosyltransferase involved in cell wall biosynthesis
MLWLHLSNITYVARLTGIPRTEYETFILALQKRNAGEKIKFCTYYADRGFIELGTKEINDIVHRFESIQRDGLNHYYAHEQSKRKKQRCLKNFCKRRWNKTKLSIQKRIHVFNRYFNKFYYPFSQGDTIISVGLNINSKDMNELAYIKQKRSLYIKVFCHDIIPITHSGLVTKEAHEKFTVYFQKLTKVADFFYCNSYYTQSELRNYLKQNNCKIPPIEVIHLGCDIKIIEAKQNVNESIKRILAEKFLLFVSTIEIRKNHRILYEAYSALIARKIENLPKLLFVGQKGWMVDDLLKKLSKDERVQGKILIFDDVTDNELALFYQHCLFTLYPSFVEGYGLPIAESLAYGKYCLAANTSSLMEVGQDFIDYLDPTNVQAWVDKLEFLLCYPEYIKNKEKKICKRYSHNSWKQSARIILGK